MNDFEVEFEEVKFDDSKIISERVETKLEDILVNEFEHVKSEESFLKFNFNDSNNDKKLSTFLKKMLMKLK